jgi:ATP-dependent Clp protease ATP-binding subunit ClpA
MFERFTDAARRVLVRSQEEARALRHSLIDTEHILLALLGEEDSIAAKALAAMEVTRDRVEAKVYDLSPPINSELGLPQELHFSPDAKKVFEVSLREALQLGANYIGTEHMLLALVRHDKAKAAQILAGMGVDLSVAREKVMEVLSHQQPEPVPVIPTTPENQLQTLQLAEGNCQVLETILKELIRLRSANANLRTLNDLLTLLLDKDGNEALRQTLRALQSRQPAKSGQAG